MMKWAISCFKFFASLRLAVLLILAIAVVVGIGTFIESYHGTEAAQILIYQTNWFCFLLILLVFNLLASALDRIPWKKKHIGFLTVHLGIILILLGAFMTAQLGVEGQMAIQEGESRSRMTLTKPILKIFSSNSQESSVFYFKQHALAWSGRTELPFDLKSSFSVYLLSDYPKAEIKENIRLADTGSPALHVSLSGSMAQSEHWLFLNDPEKNQIVLGPAVIRFVKEPLRLTKETEKGMGRLRFEFENGETVYVSVDQKNKSKKIKVGKTPYQIQIERVLKDAMVDQNQLIERSSEWKNPAVELGLEGNGLKEHHTVFSNFPEFPTLHGIKPNAAHVRIIYEVPGSTNLQSKNELRFIDRSGLLPMYQVKKGSDVKEGTVEIGKSVSTGWMDFQFTVDQYDQRAEIERKFLPLPSASARADAVPAIQVELIKGDEKKTIWLLQGEMNQVRLGDEDFHMMYGLETKPIGFSLKLKDFVIETDPGTDKPASFKSEVTLKDAAKAIERDATIQMNQPLIYRGFKIYQSAYQQVPGEPDISIFAVAKDPGIPLKYAGAVILISGIMILFYVKPLSTLKSSDPKLRNR